MSSDISVVVPIHDEESNVAELVRRLGAALDDTGLDWEVVFVDDGSRDKSLPLLLEARTRDPRFKIVELSRNFGHQVAVTAGIDHARGRAVIVMDGDLQDPPELLPDLVRRWQEGFEVVYGVRRRREEGLLRRAVYALFYRLLRSISEIEIPVDSGDFALMDRRAVEMLRTLPERNRYVRGLRAWVGFRQTSFEYERSGRHSGSPKYDFGRLLRLALDGIVSFSDAPLRLMRDAGLLVTVAAGLLGLWTLFKRLILYEVVPGFATLALLILFFGGVQLVSLGILGEYIARIYGEVKQRHRYVLRGLHGVEPSPERHGLPPRAGAEER